MGTDSLLIRKAGYRDTLVSFFAAGTILIGSLMMYFAHLDYNDADEIKKDLKIPGAVKGKNYQDKVKKNKKLVDQGDNKAIAGGILLGTGAALLGVGLYFYF